MQTKLKKEDFYKILDALLNATSRPQYFFCLISTFLILLSFSLHSQQANLPFEDVSVDQGMPTYVYSILRIEQVIYGLLLIVVFIDMTNTVLYLIGTTMMILPV